MTPPAAQTSDTDLTPSASPSSNETDEALSPPDIHNPEMSVCYGVAGIDLVSKVANSYEAASGSSTKTYSTNDIS